MTHPMISNWNMAIIERLYAYYTLCNPSHPSIIPKVICQAEGWLMSSYIRSNLPKTYSVSDIYAEQQLLPNTVIPQCLRQCYYHASSFVQRDIRCDLKGQSRLVQTKVISIIWFFCKLYLGLQVISFFGRSGWLAELSQVGWIRLLNNGLCNLKITWSQLTLENLFLKCWLLPLTESVYEISLYNIQ